MKTAVAKPQRCAIYTRKSTEHNLDLAFNSLDAQREACEAYIKKSVARRLALRRRSLRRRRIVRCVARASGVAKPFGAGPIPYIDIIVVYKVDRLTRSLADFAKLVELFDEFDVSFVSVTQSFNTTSSMGRLTPERFALLRPVLSGR